MRRLRAEGPLGTAAEAALALIATSGAPGVVDSLSTADVAWLASRQIDSLYYVATGLHSRRQAAYDAFWARQHEVLLEAVQILAAAGVEAAVIKGAAFHLNGSTPGALGAMADVDLLVEPDEREIARSALTRAGFVQGPWDEPSRSLFPLPADRVARLEERHYELVPFGRVVRLELPERDARLLAASELEVCFDGAATVVVVRVDVHHAISLDADADGILARSVTLPGTDVHVLSPADAVWTTLCRSYAEVASHQKRGLRDFAYVLGLLNRHDVAWETVRATNERLGLYASLYYYLRFVDWMTEGRVVPADVIDAASPLRSERVHDHGWQLGRLFDCIEPSPFS